jgi:crossover junction endodeoxyribonuclease RuvC
VTEQKTPIIILGIDPGTIVTGYGIISLAHNKITAIDFGCIRPKKTKLSLRYRYIFEGICELCDLHQPTSISIEKQYVNKNVQSALTLGMAKGACLIAASLREIPVFEYAPSVAKKALVGKGNASKRQIQSMCKHLLSLSQMPEPEDAADALSLALCHIHTLNLPHIQHKEI